MLSHRTLYRCVLKSRSLHSVLKLGPQEGRWENSLLDEEASRYNLLHHYFDLLTKTRRLSWEVDPEHLGASVWDTGQKWLSLPCLSLRFPCSLREYGLWMAWGTRPCRVWGLKVLGLLLNSVGCVTALGPYFLKLLKFT
ncbi:hypothetical protein AMTR_s00081p00177690 [Amborella trichopoda]|uniref:Uncharacterized protein n=1 Tax=Amborella trichopoda TaxID=13333 RepID=W1P3U8_AMBTC|nr:hypothetical protein AMTR_s00081p00177690 [Amborella trichopoda]